MKAWHESICVWLHVPSDMQAGEMGCFQPGPYVLMTICTFEHLGILSIRRLRVIRTPYTC